MKEETKKEAGEMELIINHMPAREVSKRIKDAGYYIARQEAYEYTGWHNVGDVYYIIIDSKGEIYGDPLERLWEAREGAIRSVLADKIGWGEVNAYVELLVNQNPIAMVR
jgi:hypothetical protein